MSSDFNPEKIIVPPELEGRLFFTPAGFGAMLGVHRATIFRWAAAGVFKTAEIQPPVALWYRKRSLNGLCAGK
jgi:hypothetical protein